MCEGIVVEEVIGPDWAAESQGLLLHRVTIISSYDYSFTLQEPLQPSRASHSEQLNSSMKTICKIIIIIIMTGFKCRWG